MAQIRTEERLTLAERRALRMHPVRRRARALEACREAVVLVDAGDLEAAEEVLMHAYHEGATALDLWLGGVELALERERARS